MYNYDFNSEKVIYEKVNCIVGLKQREIFISILVTDQNLLLFYNPNRGTLNERAMGVILSPNYELLRKISLKDIKYTCDDNNTYIDNDIVIYDFDLSKVLNK